MKIIGLATIALSLTSCLRDLNTLQLKTKIETLKISIPENKSNSKSQPLGTIKNLNFTVYAKFQGKTVYKVEPRNNEKVVALTIDDSP